VIGAGGRRRPIGPGVVAVALVGLLAQGCTGGSDGSPDRQVAASATPASSVGAQGRPNIAIILTDDQATSLFSRELMPNVFSRLVDRGVNFTRAYVNVSQCCPSRSSILTGLYSHHTGVDSNDLPLDGQVPIRPTIAVALHGAGYRTMLAGKYLNSESCEPRPGWDQWVCGTRVTQVNPLLNVNGKQVQQRGYTSDILASRAASFVRESDDPDHPFFLYFAPKSPHLPADDDRFASLEVPEHRPPSFDALPDPASRPLWARVPPLSPALQRQNDARFASMTRLIPPLDAAIGNVLDAIEERGDDTLVIMMSDNGFLYGEHRLTDKIAPYEESVRVPMVIRYPAVLPPARHFASDALVSNVDVAPTVMDAAGIPWEADGASLVPILAGATSGLRDELLIEWCQARAGGICPASDATLTHVRIPPYVGVVTDRYAYVRYSTGERELYDLEADPYELRNLAGAPAQSALEARLEAARLRLFAPPPTPGTTIADGPVGTISAGAATFQFFSQERTTGFRCVLSGPGHTGGEVACNGGTASYDRLSAGSYVFTVRAVDPSGLADPSPATRRFFVSA
jgi:N-acetylglucosamine-6-sulfatase